MFSNNLSVSKTTSFHLTAATQAARRSFLNPLSAVASLPGGIMHNAVVWNNTTKPYIRPKVVFSSRFSLEAQMFFFFSIYKSYLALVLIV